MLPQCSSHNVLHHSTLLLRLANKNNIDEPVVSVSSPSQAEAEAMGIRDWPQQAKQGEWEEDVVPADGLVRYVLEGTGTLIMEEEMEDFVVALKPGTLIKVNGTQQLVRLRWKADSTMILLTPGFEESGVLLGVVAATLVTFGVLIATTMN